MLFGKGLKCYKLFFAQGGADGLIVSNTTVVRPTQLKCHKLAREGGGLSGEPLRDMATQVIGDMYTLTKGAVSLVRSYWDRMFLGRV